MKNLGWVQNGGYICERLRFAHFITRTNCHQRHHKISTPIVVVDSGINTYMAGLLVVISDFPTFSNIKWGNDNPY